MASTSARVVLAILLTAGAAPAARGDDDPLPEGALFRLGSRRLRHADPVYSVVFSPDGKLLLSADNAGTVRLWDAASGQEVRSIPKHAYAAAFSPDGRLLACLRHDQTIRVIDLLTGEELRRFRDPALPTVIAFAPDGRTLASGGRDTTVTLWDVKDLAKRKAPRADPLPRDRLAALGSDLEGADAARAFAALRALARVPDRSRSRPEGDSRTGRAGQPLAVDPRKRYARRWKGGRGAS